MNKMKTRRLFCGWMLSILLTMASSIHAAESDRLFLVHDAAEGLADNGAQVIKCTKTGRMVICSIGHINFYNGSSFNHIDASPEDSYEFLSLMCKVSSMRWGSRGRLMTCLWTTTVVC